MSQRSFSDFEYAGKRKQTRRERFLVEMDQVVPWSGLLALIEPYYPKTVGGSKPYPLETMLRIHLLQNWFSLSDPAMEAFKSLKEGDKVSFVSERGQKGLQAAQVRKE